jgi:hypothetical protein
MPVLETRKPRLGNVLQNEEKGEYGYCRKTVVANEATGIEYVAGTVLGKVTAGGKYKRLEATAADGSQNFAGIYAGSAAGADFQTLVAATDASVVVLFRDCVVGKAGLVFGASVDTQPERDAVYAQMEAAGFKVVDQPDALTTNN